MIKFILKLIDKAEQCLVVLSKIYQLLHTLTQEHGVQIAVNPRREMWLDSPDFLPRKHESELLKKILAQPGEDGAPQSIEMDGLQLPRHVSVTFITAYLEISPSTFYRQINDKLLIPARKIGNRPYFKLADLVRLMSSKDFVRHEKGAWTFSKLNRKKDAH